MLRFFAWAVNVVVLTVATTTFCLPSSVAFAASPPAIELYGTLPKTESFKISPNGEMFAMVLMAGDMRLLAVLKASGEPVFRGNIEDIKLSSLEWAGNDYVVIYTHDTGSLVLGDRSEYLQALVVDIREGKARSLLKKNADYVQAIFGAYGVAEEKGEWHVYVGLLPLNKGRDGQVTSFKQPYPDLYRVSLDSGVVTKVAPGSNKRRRWVLDEKGAVAAHSEYDDQKGEWKIFAGESSGIVSSGTAAYGFEIIGLGRAPGTIVMNSGGDDEQLIELKLDGSGQEALLPGGSELIYSPHNRLLVGAVLPRRRESTVIYEQTLGRRLESIERAFKGAQLTVTSVSSDLSKIVVLVEDHDMPGTWQFVDFSTGQATPVAEMYPGIASDMIGPVRMYAYKAADGLAMEGVLTLPPGSSGKNLPVVVIPHGGPEAADEPGFDTWAQVFASRGYAVFQPNFRGSGGYGVEFRNAGFGQWGRKMQTDISDGLAALAAEGIVDPDRACIVGASYGGYAALAGVTIQQGLYRCAASYGGVSDPADMLRQDAIDGASKSSRRYWYSYLGAASSSDIPDELSPRARAAQADAPILLVHGGKDTVVRPQQSRDMATALRRADKPVEYLELEGEDHWLSRSVTRLQWFKAMVAFVEKHNPA